MSIEEQLRETARACGWSIKRLAEETGTPYSAMHRFYVGYGGITLTTASRVAEALALELKPKRRRKGR
ncbi:MAG: helix-turn-helix domain-containing protein [Planctomycetota bacterium]|jgi:hypothetical protein